jgi:hypothetical protein
LATRAGQTEERKPDSRGPDSAHHQFLAASFQAPSSPPTTRTSRADPTRIQPRNELSSACSAPGPQQYSMVKPAAKALPASSPPRTPPIGDMQASEKRWSLAGGERRRQLEDVLDGVLQELSPRRHLRRSSRTVSVEISVSPRGDGGHNEGRAAAGGRNRRRWAANGTTSGTGEVAADLEAARRGLMADSVGLHPTGPLWARPRDRRPSRSERAEELEAQAPRPRLGTHTSYDTVT